MDLPRPLPEGAYAEVLKLQKVIERFYFCRDTPSVTYLYVKGNARRFKAVTLGADGEFYMAWNASHGVHDMFWQMTAEEIIKRFLN